MLRKSLIRIIENKDHEAIDGISRHGAGAQAAISGVATSKLERERWAQKDLAGAQIPAARHRQQVESLATSC